MDKMGLATNLALFMFCLSFVFYMFGYNTLLLDVIGCFQNPSNVIPGAEGYSCTGISQNLYQLMTSQIGVIGLPLGIVVSVLALGSTTVFSIIGLALFGLATWPVDLLNSPIVPQEIKLFIGGVYMFGFIIAMISWLKIGSTP